VTQENLNTPSDSELRTFACEWWNKFGFVKDKATCTWVIEEIDPEHFVDFSRDLLARWGKPPTLKEQAMIELDGIATVFRMSHGGDLICDKIRRALEALPND
jgi:hypothetical protein